MKISPNNPCLCGSLLKYKKCCKVFHDGALAKTALELMKSRYCAFSLGKSEYIISTTHEKNPDFSSDIKSWKADIINFSKNTQFENLEILDFVDDEIESFVTFKATLTQNNNDVSFCERSRFLKVEQKWLYVDGEFLEG